MKNKFLLKTFFVFTLVLSVDSFELLASTGKSADPNYLSNLLANTLMTVCVVIAVGILVYLFRLAFVLLNLEKNRLYKEKGIAIPETKPKLSFWQSFYQKATDAVPISQEEDVMLDHNYDGIRELDNSLPPWWVAMFYITIVIGVVYFAYYHYYNIGLSSSEEYAIEMERAEIMKTRFLAKQANLIDESNVVALTDEASLAQGAALYKSTCVACHGQLGEGGIGPNMTDEYWLHGGDMKSIFATIKYGVPAKGMIAWKDQLGPSDIHKVASYLMTLKGTNPPNAKAAQGVKFEEEKTEQ